MSDFFSKLGDELDKGVKAVSSKSKEYMETKKLREKMKDVQRTIDNKFLLLGKKIFEMLNKNELFVDELRADSHEILLNFRNLSELEREIKNVELEAFKMKYGDDAIMCPQCKGINKKGDKFCGGCGSAVIVQTPDDKFCPACTVSLKPNARFCGRCGSNVDQVG